MNDNDININISVIIPAYNCERTIHRTLKSILNQQQAPAEIIIINDGSTDNTEEICEKYSAKYKNIKVINLKKNKGVSNARNVGIKFTKGNYIHFVDADDTIEDNIYSIVSKKLKKNRVDCIEFGSNFVIENEKKIIEKRHIEKDLLCLNKNNIADFLKTLTYKDKERVLNVIWNKIYSKKTIADNNIKFDMNINLGEDFLFNCSFFSQMTSYSEIHDCLYNYFKNQANNLTSKFREDVLTRRKKIYFAWINLYKKYNIYNFKGESYFEKYEGKMLYYSLYSIFSPNCKLNNKDKEEFLGRIINDQHSCYITKYLKFGIEKKLLKLKKITMLFNYMKIKTKIKKIIKEKLNRRGYD